MGPRAGVDECGKPRPPLGFDPRTVQSVAGRKSDCATPAHNFLDSELKLFLKNHILKQRYLLFI